MIPEECLLKIISEARPPEAYIDYINPRTVSRKFLPKFFEILPESGVRKNWSEHQKEEMWHGAYELLYFHVIWEFSKIVGIFKN
jgi:hypothetical protein